MTRFFITGIVLLAALYTGSVEAKTCTEDQKKFGCFPKNGECRAGGFVWEQPCKAPEQAPINQYNCYGEVSTGRGGGHTKTLFGPRTLRAKVYEWFPNAIQISSRVDPEVKALIGRWTAECQNELKQPSCYVRCIKK